MESPQFWTERSSWQGYCLQPLATLYTSLMKLRKQCYQRKIFRSYRAPVPVVVIGNLTVGGTGKTPLVIALTSRLRAEGWKPGIVSRGYGGKSREFPRSVTLTSDPRDVGDEPVCLAEQTGVPVIVDPDRPRAIQYCLEHFACDIILSDDGLQHYAMQRDVEVVVIDGVRRFGNERCLPAGPLREPLTRLQEVDFIVNNGGTHEGEFHMDLVPGVLVNLLDPSQLLSLDLLQGKTLHAVAGIGYPQRFFKTLDSLGVRVIPHPLPDHATLTPHQFIFKDDLPIVMTHKDAVKCRHFAKSNFWYLPVTARCEERFFLELIAKLRRIP